MRRPGGHGGRWFLVAGVALVVTGCGRFVGPGVGVGAGPLPDRPMADNAIPPLLTVAQGVSATGAAYRAWIYRTQDGLYCFEVAQASSASSGCGPDVASILGLGSGAGDPTQGSMTTGGTAMPGVARAVATLADGTQVPVQLVRPGGFLGEEVRVFVLSLPPGATVRRVDYLDADGQVVETAETF